MANCELCKQKLPFMGGETFLVGEKVQGISVGDNYILCQTCMGKIKAAQNQDINAQVEVRLLATDAISDTRKRKDFLAFLNISPSQEEIEKAVQLSSKQKERMRSIEAYRKAEIERVTAAVADARERYLNCDVAAGKKANDTVSIGYDTLMLYGIYEIADIEIGFDISDDDYNHTYTGPRMIQTTAAEGYDYETPCYRESIASKESQAQYDYSVPYFSSDPAYEENGLIMLRIERRSSRTSMYPEILPQGGS